MFRVLITLLLMTSLATAQSKKPAAGGSSKKPANAARQKAIRDSIVNDSLASTREVFEIPKEFSVYTRRSKNRKERMKLCINLVSKDSTLNYCVNDSICRDPELSKILFEKVQGDTNYVLVYIRAFSKPQDKPSCDAGKEVKLYFFRWNTKTNKALIKLKNVESCMKDITNMSKDAIDTWDGSSPLVIQYYKGGQGFVEAKFDPVNYRLGLQSAAD